MPVPNDDVDERLLELLRKAGDEWGPAGVARAATQLANPDELPASAVSIPTLHLLQFFDNAHLPENLRAVAEPCKQLAYETAKKVPGGPELTAGLRKLLEAKDCFVRAAL